jgi:peptidoglycan/LPS O-acetylase OafA/YrhL
MTRRTPIYGLDLIRFGAASLVMVYHLGFKTFGGSPDAVRHMGLPPMLPPWWAASWFGWIGVQIFFVISGLVIAYSARDAKTLPYIVGRISRLLPVMLIAATFAALIEITFYHGNIAHIAFLWVKSVTFFPIGPWISGQIWTLPVEIFFYGMVALLIFSGKSTHLERLAWALAIASGLYWLEIMLVGFDPLVRITQLLGLQHGCYFALGIALSAMTRDGRNRARFVLIGLCMLTAVLQIRMAAIWEKPGYGLENIWPVAYLVFAVVVGLIGASLYFRDAIAARVNARQAALLRMAGLITYPLYLIHIHVAAPIILLLSRTPLPVPLILLYAALTCIVVSCIISQLLEPPLNRVIKSWLNRQAARHPSSVVRIVAVERP